MSVSLSYDTIFLVALAFLLGGFVKGVIGLGFPVVVLAMLATTIGLKEAMALLVIPAVVTNVWQALAGGALINLVKRLWTMLVMSIAGIWLGVGILASVETAPLVAVLGILLFSYSVFSLARPQLSPPRENELWLSPVMGAAGGFVFGLTGSYMVPGVLYIQTLGLSRDQFIQALGIIFFTITVALGLFFWQRNLIGLQSASISAAALVPITAGMLLGQRLRHHLSEELFRKVFFVALIFVGIYMVARAFF